MADGAVPKRISLGGAVEDRLFFAQVREDPVLEMEALQPAPEKRIVVVSSGGCTALSLLGAGAGEVVAVDLNVVQNHLVELKHAAVAGLGGEDAVAFLGGWPAAAQERRAAYRRLRVALSPPAQAYWDGRSRVVEGGVLDAGVSERFISVVMRALRTVVHPPSRVRRLLECPTLEDQRRLYETQWDNRRWRLLFTLLLNRAVFRRTYDPAFFRHVDNPSFARHFYELAGHALTEVPVSTNYFVHHMLTGSYPRGVAGGLPPYLEPAAAGALRDAGGRLTLVDGSYVDYLRSLPDASVDGFALSNICEWLDAGQIDDLLGEVVRTARPGGTLVFRNFVGWTEVPPRWQAAVVEDRARGEDLIRRDRSALQRRFAVCRLLGAGA